MSLRTDFTVHVVSEHFQGKVVEIAVVLLARTTDDLLLSRMATFRRPLQSTMQRHRMIYSALSDELAAGLHALSLKTKTPSEAQPTTQV